MPPTSDIYWDRAIETMPRPEIEALQLRRLKEIVGYGLQTNLYKKRFSHCGISSPDDICSLDELRKIPFTVKDDLRQSYPKGLLAVPDEDIVRMHSSSGTTGIPTVIYYTAADLAAWTDLLARSIYATGARRADVFQNMMSYGLFTGGLGLHYGAEALGMMIIPIGGGNTKRQIVVMKDFNTTVLHITPSYLLHIASQLDHYNIGREQLSIKKAYLGAEPYSENTKNKIEELLAIDVYNSYGLSEMNGPGVAFECEHKRGMHLWEDGYIVEIIDPQSGENLPDGAEGEVVLTNLIRRGTPLLRYRTRDRAFLYPEPCPCGRTHRRLSRITGRTDDMLIINGVNVFPSQIEEVIMCIPEVGTNYQIHIEKEGALDKLVVKVEIYSKLFHGDLIELDLLKDTLTDELRASITIRPHVELHEPGSLPVYEGKAKRVIDTRERL
jgi:phenylacetate-CoA ligase